MAPPYQELADLRAFLRLGLPAVSLRAAPTTHEITHTGGSASLRPVGPNGAESALDVGALLVTSLDVLVDVVVGGALGVATWRFSTNGGATWSATATVPATGTLVLGHTGLIATVSGALTLGERWTWAAVSCVRECLRAANDRAARWLHRQFTPPLTEVPADIVRDVCVVAAADVLAVRGYNPATVEADALIERRAREVREGWREIRDGEVAPRVGESAPTRRGPRVATGTRR